MLTSTETQLSEGRAKRPRRAWQAKRWTKRGRARQARNEDHGDDRQGRLTLAVVSAGTLLVLVGFTSVVTTVAATAHELRAGTSGKTWILGAISLGLAASLLTVGSIADRVGRRRVFVCATLGLSAASVLGALAPTIGVLILARVLQGIAGAGVLAAGLGLIGHTFRAGPARTHATGLWGAMVGAGIAVGPAASAGLAAFASWRTVYWVIAGVAVLLVPFAARMPESRSIHPRRLDLPGALIFPAAMACLIAGLTLGRQSWTQTSTILLLALAGILLVGFVVVERLIREPLLDLRLFTRPLFLASASGALFTGLALIALMSFMPQMLKKALGETPLTSAGILAVWSLPSMFAAMQARRLPPRIGSATRLIIGFVLCAIGLAMLTGLDPHAAWLRLAPGLFIAGIGSGITNAALGRLAVESVPPEDSAIGSAANNTARYLGGAAGIAIVVAVVAAGNNTQGAVGLINGWNLAALLAATMCLLAAGVAAWCRSASTYNQAPAASQTQPRSNRQPDELAQQSRHPSPLSPGCSSTSGAASLSSEGPRQLS